MIGKAEHPAAFHHANQGPPFVYEGSVGIVNIKSDKRMLKITIPEDLNYHDTFSDIFEDFTKTHVLYAVKTADLGSVFILTYHVVMKNGTDEKEMLDKIRCRNANLDITFSQIPQEER